MCDEAERDPRITTAHDAELLCRKSRISGAAALARALDALEPGGPKGKVQVGYTATLQLLGIYQKTAKGWDIDESQVSDFLRLVTEVRRPTVIYLAADHFDSFGPLTHELQKDPQNLMQLRDGRPLNLNYFGYHVIPYTLLTDPGIPVNQYRYRSLTYVAKKILALPRDVQDRIVAITLVGELHHMFPDFENGMGAFKDIQVTDYSPKSVNGFQAWLRKRFGNVDMLNRETNMSFRSFDSITAPAKDIRKERLAHFGEHYDTHADGSLTFTGWISDPGNRIERVDLYIDGVSAGPVERHLNRLDVYRAIQDISSPNVGYRYRLDYSHLSAGRHHAQIVVASKGKKYLATSIDFVVMPRDKTKPPDKAPKRLLRLSNVEKGLKGVRTWLDMPASGQDLYFNPLARLWNEYRAWQVQNMLQEFHTRALKAGLPVEKLYSHQIMPDVNSSWNAKLFSAGETLSGSRAWKHGINLYGGATNSPWIWHYLEREKIRDYGVPEFHPQQWKSATAHTDALRAHYEHGARFVSPYYLSIIPKRFKGTGVGINRLELDPTNKMDGSDRLYQALIEFAKQ